VSKRGAYGAPEKTKFFWGVKPLLKKNPSPSLVREGDTGEGWLEIDRHLEKKL
jgi:hypothetical protein